MIPQLRAEKIASWQYDEIQGNPEMMVKARLAFIAAQIEEAEREAVSIAQMEWEGVRLPTQMASAFEEGFAAARKKAAQIAELSDFGPHNRRCKSRPEDHSHSFQGRRIANHIREMKP